MSESLPNFLSMPLGLFDEEFLKSHLKLRFIKQIIVSQVMYILNVWRNLILAKYPNKTQKIGIIGCGVIGKLILNSIIPYTKIKDSLNLKTWQIEVSTRRPETLTVYENLGVQIYFDNEKLIQNCDFIIVGLPPTLDNWTLLEIKSYIQKKVMSQNKPFILSLISNISNLKIQRIFQIEHQICTTQIKLTQIESVLDEYLSQAKLLIQQQKEKKNNVEIDENITHLIKKETFNHFYGDSNFIERTSNFLICLSQCVQKDIEKIRQESYQNCLQDDFISQSLLEINYHEFKSQQENGKINHTIHLMQSLKKGFDKKFYDYQILLQQNQKE